MNDYWCWFNFKQSTIIDLLPNIRHQIWNMDGQVNICLLFNPEFDKTQMFMLPLLNQNDDNI